MYLPYSIEELQEAVWNMHGLYVPLEEIFAYQGVYPDLTPEDLYCLVCDEMQAELLKVQSPAPKETDNLPKTEEESKKSLYHNLAIFAGVLLAIFLLLCFFAYA